MEKDFRDAVNKTMDRVLKMDIYRGPVEILEQRVQASQREKALNNGLAKNEQAKTENTKGAKPKEEAFER